MAVATLGKIGVILSITWLIEEIIQRIQVTQMIMQRAQQMAKRQEGLGDKDPFKDVTIIVSPTETKGEYTVTVRMRLDMPLKVNAFTHPWMWKDMTVCGFIATEVSVSNKDTGRLEVFNEVGSGMWIDFPADQVLAPKEVTFRSKRFAKLAVWIDIPYRTGEIEAVAQMPYYSTSCPACTSRMGKTRCDWWERNPAKKAFIYHRVHGEEFPVPAKLFDEADAAYYAMRVAALQSDLQSFQSFLNDLKEAANFIENQWFRDDYPTWLLEEKIQEFAKMRDEAVRKLQEWRKTFEALADEIQVLFPEEAAKLRMKWKETPLPDVNALKTSFPRTQLEERIRKEEAKLADLTRKLEGNQAKLRSLSATYVAKLLDSARTEISNYLSALKKRDPALIATARAAVIAKVRAILEEYKAQRASLKAEEQSLRVQITNTDYFIKWLRGEIKTPSPPTVGGG
ncbi:MAG: hypothetical protein QXT28_11465 [Thermofilaceae archaeon]